MIDFKLKEIDREKLYNFLREMEFNRLLSSVISKYGELEYVKEKKFLNTDEHKKINIKDYVLIQNEIDLKKWLIQIEEKGEVAIDTETTSLDPHQANLVGISIATDIGKAGYIPLGHVNGNNLNEKKL